MVDPRAHFTTTGRKQKVTAVGGNVSPVPKRMGRIGSFVTRYRWPIGLIGLIALIVQYWLFFAPVERLCTIHGVERRSVEKCITAPIHAGKVCGGCSRARFEVSIYIPWHDGGGVMSDFAVHPGECFTDAMMQQLDEGIAFNPKATIAERVDIVCCNSWPYDQGWSIKTPDDPCPRGFIVAFSLNVSFWAACIVGVFCLTLPIWVARKDVEKLADQLDGRAEKSAGRSG